MLDNKVIIDLDDYVDDIDVDLSDVVIAHSTPPLLQDKTVSPTTSQQEIMADVGYSGLNKVTINAVTSAIDNNIQPSNIKSGVSILGVAGTLVAGGVDVVQNYSYFPILRGSNIRSYTNLDTNNYSGTHNNTFRECHDMIFMDLYFAVFETLTNRVFMDCEKLSYIIFRAISVVPLSSTSNFTNAGTQNTNPNHVIYIYVPSSLIANYRTATNWATLYNDGLVDFLPIQ